MGTSFWILVWDGWGCGLDMLSPRLHYHYDRERVFMRNSFDYQNQADIDAWLEKMEIETLYGDFFKVIK